VASNGFEVAIAVEHLGVDANGDGGDDAVDAFADRLAMPPAGSEDRGGVLEVRHAFQRDELVLLKEAPDPRNDALVARPGEKLHDDNFGGHDVGAVGEQVSDSMMERAISRPEKLDPS
jgi:hypothetical protein